MFRTKKLCIFCIAFVLFLNWSVNGDYIVPPVRELCPCLPRNICPRHYGMSPIDEFYLGVILKCAQDDHVRCCGVSIERVVGARAITSSESTASTTETSSMAPVVTTSVSTNELTTIPSELDVNGELSELNQSQTTLINEITSKPIYDTTLPIDVTESAEEMVTVTVATVPRIQVPRKPDIYHIFPSSEFDEPNSNGGNIDPNAPAMVIFAEKHANENHEESMESNDVASTEETVELNSIEPETVELNSVEPEKAANTETSIELSGTESKLDSAETPNGDIEETSGSKGSESDVTELNTVEPTEKVVTETETVEPEAIKSETVQSEIIEPKMAESETIEPEAVVVKSVSNPLDETETVEPVTTMKTIESDVEQVVVETTEANVIEPEVVELSTFEPKSTESAPTESETDVTESQNTELGDIELKTVESETVKSEVVDSEMIKSETMAPGFNELTTIATIDEPKTTQSSSTELNTVDVEAVEKTTQEIASSVTESETVQPEAVEVKAIEPESIESEATELNTVEPTERVVTETETVEPETIRSETVQSESIQSNTIEPEISEQKTNDSADETKTDDSTSTESKTEVPEVFEKSTEEIPQITTTENLDFTKATESEAIEETTVDKSIETTTENQTTEKAIENENTEKTLENETTMKSIDVTGEKMVENQVIEKILEHEVTESMIEITTLIPTTELNELKQLDLTTESLASSSTTESNSNMITTTAADVDATVPDLISTMEASNMVEVRYNKRRESIYQGPPHEMTSTPIPIPIPSPSDKPISKRNRNRNRKSQPYKNQSVENVVPVENVASQKRIPLQSTSTHRPISEHKFDPGHKFTSAHKIPSLNRSLDEDHKMHIMEVHTMLSSLVKLPIARPPFSRSKTLEQLIAHEQSLNQPKIPNRNKNYLHKKNSFEPSSPPPPVATTEEITTEETSTQTEKPKRKYNRRKPAQKFSVGSIKTATTTTTTTTTELPNVSTTARQYFTRRKSYIRTKAPNSNESTTVSIDVTTKPNERLQNFNSKMSLEMRKRLFEARRYGKNQVRTTTTETPSTTETAIQPEKLPEGKPVIRNQYRQRLPQHRFKLKPERTSDDDSTN